MSDEKNCVTASLYSKPTHLQPYFSSQKGFGPLLSHFYPRLRCLNVMKDKLLMKDILLMKDKNAHRLNIG